ARWLLRPRGELILYVSGRRRRVDIGLTLSSFARPRRVSVSLGRRKLATFEVHAGAYVTRSIAAGSLAAGRYSLSLSSRPRPAAVQPPTATTDTPAVPSPSRHPLL